MPTIINRPATIEAATITDPHLNDAALRLWCWLQTRNDIPTMTTDEAVNLAATALDWHPVFVLDRLRDLDKLGYLTLTDDEGA